jgi:AraC-like DNA-binding protein
MVYRAYIPRKPLSDFVEKFWFYEGYAPRGSVEGLLPDGSMNLIVNLGGDEGPRLFDPARTGRVEGLDGCVVTGAHSGFAIVDTAGLAVSMGVHFKPGGAFPFLGFSAAELRDAHAPLESIWGSKPARELRGRLFEARTPEAGFLILERALLAGANRPLERHPAVSLALEDLRSASPAPTISELIERTGLSRKRFVKVFRYEVGLTPKLFSRIHRFQDLVRIIEGGRRVDWGELALMCGYFDQAHFIHDFRSFSGLSPGSYVTRRGAHANHVVLPGD